MVLPIESARTAALRRLAVARMGAVTAAEGDVLARCASTESQPGGNANERPVIRSAFLRWLATDQDAARFIDPLGLRVDAATIPTDLDLDSCRIPFPLRFHGCIFQGRVSLRWAEIRALELSDCTAEKEIFANGLTASGNLDLRGLHAQAALHFVGAQIAGDLDCGGACLRSTGVSLDADGARVNGGVFLEGLSSAGTIRLAFAQVGGDLNCPGARLTARDLALHAYGAKIRGGIFLRDGFSALGTVRFPLMQTEGDFDCSGAERFGYLRCENARVDGRMILTNLADAGSLELKLNGAVVGEYHDDRESWPLQDRLHIDGFVYKDLVLHESASPERIRLYELGDWQVLDPDTRIDWIKRQPEKELGGAQPWMQLAQLLEADGDPGGAKRIIYEYHRQQAKQQSWLVRPLSWIYDSVQEDPLRISVPILGFWALGALVFWRAARVQAMRPAAGAGERTAGASQSEPRHSPPFHPAVYALENVLPVVKLGQDSAWGPDPEAGEDTWLPENERVRRFFQQRAWTRWVARLNYRRLAGLRWALILFGWAMALILAAAIGGIFRP